MLDTCSKLALETSNHRRTVVYTNDEDIDTSDRNLKKDIVDLDNIYGLRYEEFIAPLIKNCTTLSRIN